MRQTVLYIFFFISTTLLFSCKKYPEGGCERRGSKNILGRWKLTLYEVDGIDSTNLINYNGTEGYKEIIIYKESSKYSPRMYTRVDQIFLMTVDFENDHKDVVFGNNENPDIGFTCLPAWYAQDTNCYRMIFTPENDYTKWQILKLKKDEFVLSTKLKHSYKIELSLTSKK